MILDHVPSSPKVWWRLPVPFDETTPSYYHSRALENWEQQSEPVRGQRDISINERDKSVPSST